MKMQHLVVWLDTQTDTESSRSFDSWQEADQFMRELRRKFPHSPIEYTELEK
jgi:hypothetical protein